MDLKKKERFRTTGGIHLGLRVIFFGPIPTFDPLYLYTEAGSAQ